MVYNYFIIDYLHSALFYKKYDLQNDNLYSMHSPGRR